MSSTKTKNNIGYKIARIRELRGIKQETLAEQLGISQQSISNLERSDTLDDEKLKKVAEALGVTKTAIENFSEEKAINFFSSVYDNNFSNSQGTTFGSNLGTFNPIDKIVELFEEKEKLYERLLQAEKDKVKFLEDVIKQK